MINSIIPYGRQNITQEDIDAVINALKSDYLTQGPKINEFESKFAKYVDSKYAVAVSNGTAALHLCTLVLGVNEGDKVITTPITFVASANCVRYCGGEVVFSDIDEQTLLIDIPKVQKLLEASPKGTYTGIIPVDFSGRPVDMEELRKLANKYDMWILEDACHAPGASFIDSKGNIQYSGNGVFADLAIFSFHPVKHIATGEGGMITTNNKALYEKLIFYRTHGIIRNKDNFQNSVEFANGSKSDTYPEWYMEMQELGFNYRLTDIQAALGISQLTRAEHNLQIRKEIAKRYDLAFKDHNQIKSPQHELNSDGSVSHAYHLYVIQVENRLGLYEFLRSHQIFCQVHYIPAHLMPYYRQFGWNEGDMPVAENYYKGCISLPMYPTLLLDEQEFVIKCINEFLQKN